MIKAEIKAVFREPPIEYDDVIIRLEQKPWDDNTGLMKKSDFYEFVSTFLNFNTFSETIDCGIGADGEITCIIYVYVYPFDLQYELKVNYGELSEKSIETIEQVEVASFSIANRHSLGKVPVGPIDYEWIGDIFDKDGSRLDSPPTVRFGSMGEVFLNKKVYGDLQLKYSYTRHSYELKANVSDGFVSSNSVTTGEAQNGLVAYAIWHKDISDEKTIDERIEEGEEVITSIEEETAVIKKLEGEERTLTGGIVWINLQPPPNSDENGKADSTCGFYPYGEEDEEDEEDTDSVEAPFTDKIITVDYCTQEVISETTKDRDPGGGSSSLTTF